VGIEERVRKSALPQESDVACWCESLNGPLVTYTQPAPNQHTPAPRAIVAQDAVEEALWDEIAARPNVRIRRRSEFVSVQQDDSSVLVRLRDLDTGEISEVRAHYLVGCDGANSAVRADVGIEMDGPETMALMATTTTAPMSAICRTCAVRWWAWHWDRRSSPCWRIASGGGR
jgi:2-polyprenyl-6-methoxyphenol hydroxylase-like FAD-dependent oxidoreductase